MSFSSSLNYKVRKYTRIQNCLEVNIVSCVATYASAVSRGTCQMSECTTSGIQAKANIHPKVSMVQHIVEHVCFILNKHKNSTAGYQIYFIFLFLSLKNVLSNCLTFSKSKVYCYLMYSRSLYAKQNHNSNSNYFNLGAVLTRK